ncbi:MAG: carbohydrate ABC transporter permease [Bacillota bacterium]|nr:carbohydrate ABC transporter permease [Bacillota bacterium]
MAEQLSQRDSSTSLDNDKKVKERIRMFPFDYINYVLLLFVVFVMLYPFWYIVIMSVSTQAEAVKPGLHLWTNNPTFVSYQMILKNEILARSFINTVVRVVLGTSLNILLTTMVAYALSKRYLPHRTLFTSIIVFTMFFSGGLIPSYLLITGMGLQGTIWSLLLPGAISTYNMVVTRNYFMAQPIALEESAKIDGASDVRIFTQIYIPLSKPILATITLWYMVSHWNAWFDALIYMGNDTTKMVLQLYLHNLLVVGSQQMLDANQMVVESAAMQPTTESLKAATIIVSTVPIVIVYPFLQKYFVQGIMVGSLKG